MRTRYLRIREKAYAKINLSLKVLGKRRDGYHEIDTVMQTISLFDDIVLDARVRGKAPAVTWSLSLSAAPRSAKVPYDGTNIVVKAARLFM